jgi:hypothetical protein
MRAREARNPAVKKVIGAVPLTRYQQLSHWLESAEAIITALSERAPSIDDARPIWVWLNFTSRFR